MPVVILLFLFSILCRCGPAPRSIELQSEYQPSIAGGVNFSETKTFRTCVQGRVFEEQPQAIERLYREKRIQGRKDLNETLNISASMSAVGRWGKPGGSVSYFKDVSMSAENFYWLVDADYLAAEKKIATDDAEFGLTDVAKEILKKEGLKAFYRACGTHFYSGYQAGGRYSLLYEFHSKSDRVVEQLKARASYSGFGVKAGADFSHFLQHAERASILDIHARIEGGGPEILDYAKDADSLTSELKKLRKDLFNQHQVVVRHWYKTSYDIFPEVLRLQSDNTFNVMSDSFRERALGFYEGTFSRNQEEIVRINRIIQSYSGEEPLFKFNAEKQEYLQKVLQELIEQNARISILASECIEGLNTCSIEGLSPITFTIPDPDEDLTGLGRWQLYFRPRAHSKVFIDVSGRPQVPGAKHHSFLTHDRLSEFSGEAHALVKGKDGDLKQMNIGTYESVIDPRSGNLVPNLCMGLVRERCQLRIVESPRAVMSDGYPASKLQLTVFNRLGFIRDRLDFLIND